MRKVAKTASRYLGLAFALFVLWSLLNCLGLLPFPVFSGRASLNGHLTEHFGLKLPDSAEVTHARNAPGRDPATFYRVTLLPGQITPFLDQIAVAARNDTMRPGDVTRPWSDMPPPSWWSPSADNCSELYEIHVERLDGSPQGYLFYLSRSKGVLYIFWYDT